MNRTPQFLSLLALGLLPGVAHAKCEALLNGLDNLASDQLVAQYKQVIRCDIKTANQTFGQFMRVASDSDTLVALSLVAIDSDIWNPVWEMVGKLTSYEARDEIANRVGQSCGNDPKVPTFLKGAYAGLREIEFAQWDDALVACEDPAFQAWILEQVENPPPRVYDDKWGALMKALVTRMGIEAVPHLGVAGAKAGKGNGPLDAILTQIDAVLAPQLGDEMSPENRKLLEDTLTNMAKQFPPQKAYVVADHLANNGSEPKAAELLPLAYPDRKRGGGYAWGGAIVESGTCGDEKQALVHVANVLDPGKRWILLDDAEPILRQTKPKLSSKCKPDDAWQVFVSPEPLKPGETAASWAAAVVKNWEGKGYVTKIKEEKDIQLP